MMTSKRKLATLFVTLLASTTLAASPPIKQKHFGTTSDGQEVTQYTLTNNKGSTASFINYAAIVTSLSVPDRNGKFGDVILGYDTVKEYELSGPSMCNVVGRFANRIGNATFTLDNTTYQLSANQGPHTLHGGMKGLGKRTWKGDAGITPDGPAVRFTILDPDGAEGFPGNLNVTVIYTLTNDDTLKIQFLANSDKATPINLCSHAFFNLSGEGKGSVNDYLMKIYGNRQLPMDATLIPTGEFAPVAGTQLDFTKAKLIGRDLKGLPGNPPGYDHSFVLDNQTGKLAKAAEVYDPDSGRLLECFTTEPGLHFTNSRNWTTLTGKKDETYTAYRGFCLETQHFSDSPNHSTFPNTILRPGQTYHQLTQFKFSAPAKPLVAE